MEICRSRDSHKEVMSATLSSHEVEIIVVQDPSPRQSFVHIKKPHHFLVQYVHDETVLDENIGKSA